MLKFTWIYLLAGAIPSAVLAQPSFDCSNVREQSAEAIICNDKELSEMDREVDRLYNKIKSQTTQSDFKNIKAYQHGWIKGRNESWKAENPREHIFQSYQRRIAVLKVQAGEMEAPKPLVYQCTGGEFDTLTVSLYETNPPVGVFTRTPGGDWPQYIATGFDDQGSIHYNTGGLDFVDRDGHVDLNWAGTLMKCDREED